MESSCRRSPSCTTFVDYLCAHIEIFIGGNCESLFLSHASDMPRTSCDRGAFVAKYKMDPCDRSRR